MMVPAAGGPPAGRTGMNELLEVFFSADAATIRTIARRDRAPAGVFPVL